MIQPARTWWDFHFHGVSLEVYAASDLLTSKSVEVGVLFDKKAFFWS